MIQMTTLPLPNDAQAYLDDKQDVIDALPAYDERVAKGQALWKNKSRTHFGKDGGIRTTLIAMCVGARRCNYCEDAPADEVEHIRPKSLYPESVFRWENHLFACGLCNGPKNNQFAVFAVNDEVVEVSRKRDDPIVPPQVGDTVLISPRDENPLYFLILDLNTFRFVEDPRRSLKEQSRATYTCKVLTLNTRDYLPQAREEAYNTYLDSLQNYVNQKRDGASAAELAQKQKELESRQHPTVWHEMQRQREKYPHLDALFNQAPELLIPNNSL